MKLKDVVPLAPGTRLKAWRRIFRSGAFTTECFEYVVGTILPDGTVDGGCGCCGDALGSEEEVEILGEDLK